MPAVVRPTRPHPRLLLAGVAALVLGVVLAIVALATRAEGSPATPDLAGRTFVSVEARGHDLGGIDVRVTFQEDHLSARGACNTTFGAATWTDGVLDAPRLGSTMMACSPDLLAQDQWLGELLASRPAITLDGTTLTIGDEAQGLVLVEDVA